MAKYFYKGRTLRKYCLEHGLDYIRIFQRMKLKCLSPEEAFNFHYRREFYFMPSGESVVNFCRQHKLNIDTVRRRLREGFSPDEAIRYRKRLPPKFQHPSVKAACVDGGHYNRALRLIAKGVSPDEAIIKTHKNFLDNGI